MYGREQPYLHKNATGTYVKTPWVDDVPGIQEGTPQDEFHFNNIEDGVDSGNLLGEFLAEVVYKHERQISNVGGEVITRTLKNTNEDFYNNNSAQTVALSVARNTLDYRVDAEIQGDVTNVGDVVIYDKQLNGFKVKYTGSAPEVTLKLYVHGGNAA